MVRRCLEYDQGFGVVLNRPSSQPGDEEPYMVGTVVRIVQVDELEDGNFELRVHGERRFRIRKILQSEPYMVGRVQSVVELEVEDNPRTDALVMRARESFTLYIQSTMAKLDVNVQIRYPTDPTALSFVIASFLELENTEKQRLLETTDTADRLADLIPLIERQILTSKPTVYRLTAEHLQEWINPN